jgi:hypothetical protein
LHHMQTSNYHSSPGDNHANTTTSRNQTTGLNKASPAGPSTLALSSFHKAIVMGSPDPFGTRNLSELDQDEGT